MKEDAGHFIFKDDLYIESSLEKEDESTLSSLLEKTRNEITAIKEEILALSEKLGKKEKEEARIKERLESATREILEIVTGEPEISEKDPYEKQMSFLYNLFHGRRDTFAERGLNKKKTGIAYYTACSNNFKEGCFHNLSDDQKKGRGCRECPIRTPIPLTKELYINRNIKNSNGKGLGAVGIYPILPGNMCRFVAIDLDEKSWKNDALVIADAARRDGFQMAIERSFSGDGAHLWLFFKEDVPAIEARKLAFAFINKALENSKEVSFRSYDKIFPSQDTVTQEGFGNLILMPIVCSAAVRKENPGTVFVDNNFVKYPRQIPFLSSLPRYTRHDVELYLTSSKSALSTSFELTMFENDESDVIWKTRLPELTRKDLLTEELPVFLSSGISIPKDALSAKLQNGLKRLASFLNPGYFKAQKKGYIPEGTSLLIETYIESETVLELPRALRGALEKYLKASNIPYRIYDKRISETNLIVHFTGTLREEQVPAFDALMSHDIGILQAATSFGKTVVAAKVIAERKEKTLILVQSKSLLDQWKKGLESFLVIDNPPVKRDGKHVNITGIGIYGNSSDSLTSYVDIAMIQTVSRRMPEFIRSYGMVIVDECHHAAAATFLEVMHAVRPRYLYGLSATVERKDSMEKLIYSQCGSVIYRYSADKLQYNRGIVQYFVPRFTESTAATYSSAKFNNTECQKDIACDFHRNSLITDDISSLYGKERRILVLTRLIDHIGELKKLLEEKGIPTVAIHGSMTGVEKKEALSRIRDDKNRDVIISTGSFLGEGVDIPYLDTLIVAAPVSWKGMVSQYVGRISREYEGKNNVLIYDYVDIFIPPFLAMYNNRLKTYKTLGYIIKDNDTALPEYRTKSFYSQDDIFPILKALIRKAETEIVISSPFLNTKPSAMKIIGELEEALGRNVYVEVRTGDTALPGDTALLSGKGIKVVQNEREYLKFISFDRKDLLFGDLDILGSYINTTDSASNSFRPRIMLFVTNPSAASSLVEPTLFS